MIQDIDTSNSGDMNQPVKNVLDLPDSVPSLSSFYLYLTDGCNLACQHCWITPTCVNGAVAAACLDFERLEAAVAEAKPLGLNSVKLTGGEPTLHPEFLRIADFLAGSGLRVTMETNGTLIDSQMAHHLYEVSKLSHIAVSLDSPEAEQHDRFRSKKGAYDATVQGLRHLVDAGFKPQIIMSVYRDNYDRVETLIELAVQLGVGSVKFNPITASGRGATMHAQGLGLSFEQTMDLVRRIRGHMQARYPIRLSLMTPPALCTVGEILRQKNDGGSCNVRHILGILGTGQMALCGIGRNVPDLCFGQLGKDSVRDVWIAHPTLVKMREELDSPYPGLCGDCIHAKRCLTHCPAMNFEATGHLIAVSPLCAEAEKRGIFPNSRRISGFDMQDKCRL